MVQLNNDRILMWWHVYQQHFMRKKKFKKKKNMIDTAHDAWKVKTDVISLISFLCVANYQSYIIINSTWMLL